MYVKIHKRLGHGEVIAVCDEGLIGKKFQDGDLFIDVKEGFYKGEKKNEEEVKNILREANNLNLVGKETIKIALSLGIITKENIIKIKGVPHAQLIVL